MMAAALKPGSRDVVEFSLVGEFSVVDWRNIRESAAIQQLYVETFIARAATESAVRFLLEVDARGSRPAGEASRIW
jgi:hypothetical protein